MSTLTIRMPDDTHDRLRDLARTRGISINKLIEEVATATLAAHDAEVRFRLMAAQGNPREALAWLDRLDAEDARRQKKGLSEGGQPFRSAPRRSVKQTRKK